MLSEQDILDLRAAVADGKPAMVWFTAKAVGVAAGKSGKVLSFATPAEGDFIEVRPTGSQDTLSFAPAELTTTRPKRQPAAKKPPPPPTPPEPEPEIQIYRPAPVEKPVKPVPPKPVQPQAKPARRGKPPAEVTVTLHATPEGEWTVDVMVGAKRSVKARPVAAVAIAKAAKELPGEVEEAISAVLAAARERHQERVAQLQAELEAARRALAELS